MASNSTLTLWKGKRLERSSTSARTMLLPPNTFDLLRDYADSGKRYDTIVLDPPAFAKSKKTLDTALRGYKELNLRALKMLRPGGLLVTCSCSYPVSGLEVLNIVAA